jgi:cytochrome c oxidase assembly factor 6
MSAKPPNPVKKEARQECYKHRDAYFLCVDSGSSSCSEQRKALEAACLPSWIKHFEQRREYLKEKAARIKMIEEQDRLFQQGTKK